MSLTDKAEIQAEMAAREKAIKDAVQAACDFADEHKLEFSASLAEGELEATYNGDRSEDEDGWYSSFLDY